MFLTERRPLSEWKTSHPSLSIEDELDLTPPSSLAILSLPSDFSSHLDQTATHTPTMVEKWTSLANLFERMAKRLEYQSLDHSRLASLIDSVEETNQATFRPISVHSDTARAALKDVQRVATAHRDLADLSALRSRAMTDSTLEGLKAQRDLWIGFAALSQRATTFFAQYEATFAANKERIATHRKKLSSLHALPSGQRPATFEQDCAKVQTAISTDETALEGSMKKRDRVKVCLWEELNLLWKRKTAAADGSGSETGPATMEIWRHWIQSELIGKSAERRAMEECRREVE